MELSWFDALPEPISAVAPREFLKEFCLLSAGLLERQAEVVADPGILSAIEWDLEQRLLELIREHFGPVQVLAEEYFGRHGCEIPGTGRVRFVLDPLDGSASYARSSERYASTLAISVDGEPAVALVFQPATRRLYSALAGHGCYVDDRLLTPGEATAPRIAVVKTQWVARERALAERVNRLVSRGYELERMESTSLKLCWIAERRRAGLVKWLSEVRGHVLDWGTLAGVLICGEVGATARRLDGGVWAGHRGGLVIGDDSYMQDIGLGA
jgi:fructose-1,6-bisphosphatase/inositol monophosphatase family enzyme